MPNNADPSGNKPPKLSLITGIILLFLALSSCGVGGLSCASFASFLAGIADGASSVALGESTSLNAATSNALVLATSADVLCVGQDENGNAVEFSRPSNNTTGTFTSGSDTFTFMYSFDTNRGSTYNVTCDRPDSAEGQAKGRYAVGSFPGFGKIGLGIAGLVSGFFLTLVGAVFLIVGLVKRSKWKKGQSASGSGAPSSPPVPSAPPAPPTTPPPWTGNPS